jgi:predicted ATPase
MLFGLNIANFKAFGAPVNLAVRPITLLFGPNSSGKSSILQSLALANNSLVDGNLDVTHTNLGGSTIDLGGFRQYVYKRRVDSEVSFGFQSFLPGELPSHFDELQQYLKVDDFVSLQASIGIERDAAGELIDGEPVVTSFAIIAHHQGFSGPVVSLQRRSHGKYSVNKINKKHPFIKKLFDAGFRKYWLDIDRRIVWRDGFARLAFGKHRNVPLQEVVEKDRPYLDSLVKPESKFSPEVKAVVKDLLDGELPSPEISAEQTDQLLDLINEAGDFPRLFVELRGLFPVKWMLKEEDLDKEALAERIEAPSSIEADEWFESEIAKLFAKKLGEYIGFVGYVMNASLFRLEYLGPTRYYPARHEAGELGKMTGDRGLGGIDHQAWAALKNDDHARALVNGWLGPDRLNTGYEFQVREFIPQDSVIKTISDIDLSSLPDGPSKAKVVTDAIRRAVNFEAQRELILFDHRTSTNVTLRDVGFGVSQVIPILVLALAQAGRLILIEEPESQLHPALAADLADLFIQAAMGEKEGAPNHFILETHSEHLMLRLLKRIRQTSENKLPEGCPSLVPSEVAVYYVEPGESGSKVIEIPITEDGEFERTWPKGFFDERLEEYT